jgi:hypothetical protein
VELAKRKYAAAAAVPSAGGTMKAAIVWKTILILLLVFAVPLAFAQKHKYDKTAEVTVKGAVEEVNSGDADKDTHLMLKTDKGLFEICLCPAKFLSALDMNFQKGDQLQVTGAKAKETDAGAEKEIILAREIVKGDNTLVLRDKDGGPVWTWLTK